MKKIEVTAEQVSKRLNENDIAFKRLPLTEGYSIIVTQFGGRILGPFRENEASLLWINGSFENGTSFRQLIEERAPLGGDRLWISPEIQFGVTDRKNFWETLFVPKDVDPGNYKMNEKKNGTVSLEQEMELEAYNLATGHKSLQLKRHISASRDPLRHLSEYHKIIKDVDFFGYTQTITLEESKNDNILSEAWTLVQVNPGGTVIVPTLSPCEITNYFSPPPENAITIQPRELCAKITGTDQYKIGMISSNTIGRIGYLNQINKNDCYLLVRCFPNNPSSSYADESPHVIGRAGHSMHIYNDDGRFGGFGEIETMGQTIGGKKGRSTTTDTSEMWFYRGKWKSLKNIAIHLLGFDIEHLTPQV